MLAETYDRQPFSIKQDQSSSIAHTLINLVAKTGFGSTSSRGKLEQQNYDDQVIDTPTIFSVANALELSIDNVTGEIIDIDEVKWAIAQLKSLLQS